MPKRWMPQRVDDERKEFVIREISEGSSPEPRFYFMVVISTLIAANGLVADSSAVIIGAMLVAPLMTPISGISLAMVRSDGYLLARSLRAETVGVAGSVLLGFFFGLIPLAIVPLLANSGLCFALGAYVGATGALLLFLANLLSILLAASIFFFVTSHEYSEAAAGWVPSEKGNVQD